MSDWKQRAMQSVYEERRGHLPKWMREAIDQRALELGLSPFGEECRLDRGFSGEERCHLRPGHWEAHYWVGETGGSAAWLDHEQIARDRAEETIR